MGSPVAVAVPRAARIAGDVRRRERGRGTPKPEDADVRAAPAFSTGGGGFEFEDLVGGFAAAALLASAEPFGVEIGVPGSIRFQAKALGYFLDDLVVEGGAAATPVVASSVKSFVMLRGERLMAEFVEEAWAQLLGPGFRGSVDYVGLFCGEAAQGKLSRPRLHRLANAAVIASQRGNPLYCT
jgi:hypothetical protein